jgi:hypothetical protein
MQKGAQTVRWEKRKAKKEQNPAATEARPEYEIKSAVGDEQKEETKWHSWSKG